MKPHDNGSHPFEIAAGAVAFVLAIAAALSWLVASLAALAFTGDWPRLSFVDALQALVRLPHHLGSPRDAWPSAARARLPGAPAMYAAATIVFAVALLSAWRLALATVLR